MIKRLILVGLLAALVMGAIIGYPLYKTYFLPNVPSSLEKQEVLLSTGWNFDQVLQHLHQEGFVQDSATFRSAAKRMNYIKDNMRSGRFLIQPGWTNVDLIRHLRGGKQAPVDVVLTTERMIENVAAKAARFIEPDSVTLLTAFRKPENLEKFGFTEETLMAMFIPNTYEFFWNTTPEKFLERMHKEYQKFWETNDRMAKAEAQDLTPAEVYTLASIVEKETLQNAEKRRMAGVYLNRLEVNMKLQADPTSVFATKDFTTKQVTDYHTNFDSPYNTYRYAGLPPGPIAMASISSIDAVLNREDHKYYYFCAKGDGSGFHNFAKNLTAHNQNARIYRANLRKRGLR